MEWDGTQQVVPIVGGQWEHDLHELGRRAATHLHDEPLRWAPWPLRR